MTSPPEPLAVVRQVSARVGLVGNPSDGHGGAVLATTVPGLSATVSAAVADHVSFNGGGVAASWPTSRAWREHTAQHGHGDEQQIPSAALWVLAQHLDHHRRPAITRGVDLEWSTAIPRSVGLAGSSALAVGVIDTTARAWGVELDPRVVAALALVAERDVLGIAAGWQDRIVQSFGTTVLVDAAQMDDVDGVRVPLVRAPVRAPGPALSLLVAWSADASGSSADYHAPLRLTHAALAAPMADLAQLARHATAALERGDFDAVAAALDAGWLIRQACAPLRADQAALVELVRADGVPATTPGSGGSVVAVCLDDHAAQRAIDAVRRAGCRFVRVSC